MDGIDEATLRFLYLEHRLSIDAIAKGFRLPPQMIADALAQWSIPVRHQRIDTPKPPQQLNEKTLRQLYVDAEHTVDDIAATYHMSRRQVIMAMKYWNIPRRRGRPRRHKENGLS